MPLDYNSDYEHRINDEFVTIYTHSTKFISISCIVTFNVMKFNWTKKEQQENVENWPQTVTKKQFGISLDCQHEKLFTESWKGISRVVLPFQRSVKVLNSARKLLLALIIYFFNLHLHTPYLFRVNFEFKVFSDLFQLGLINECRNYIYSYSHSELNNNFILQWHSSTGKIANVWFLHMNRKLNAF